MSWVSQPNLNESYRFMLLTNPIAVFFFFIYIKLYPCNLCTRIITRILVQCIRKSKLNLIYTKLNPWNAHCFLKFLEKMQAISLYWFAAQHQTSTFTLQKFGLFYVKFSAEPNELSLIFEKQQEVAKKRLSLK